ncbi:MAG TPA: LysM peptidoglycan-binding domain-containing protein [Anaerolineales bacterium]|nr:LysM peptidoglycan-binding domain-containing protein [Anaerolineales bacterium]
MNQIRMILIMLVLAVVLAACAAEPEIVEVTRVVNNEVPVTVEVTRVVPQEVMVEVPVEVTRVVEVTVEVVATPTADAQVIAAAETLTATATTEIAQATAVATATLPAGEIYTVQPGDTLSLIADKTGVAAEDIMTANNLSNANIIAVGQELVIPGWTGDLASVPNPAPNQPAEPAQPAAPVGANLFPNPSFEEGWYFFNGVAEWQLPNQWQLAVDEGPNNLSPGSGGRFFRPEIRVLSRAHIPPAEQNLFLFDGESTIKAFKGDAPTNFSIFTDVALQAGTYRFTANFFPDAVLGYVNNEKVWNGDPLAAEYRFIHNGGGTGWQSAPAGRKNTVTYDFTLTGPETVRLGVGFRNRFEESNNGWFIDDWSLQAVNTP